MRGIEIGDIGDGGRIPLRTEIEERSEGGRKRMQEVRVFLGGA